MRLSGIVGRFWLAMLLLVVIVLGLTVLIQAGTLKNTYYQQQEDRLLQEGEKLAEAISGERDPELVTRQIRFLARLMGASVMVIDARGTVLQWQDMDMGMGRRMMMGWGMTGRRGNLSWGSGAWPPGIPLPFEQEQLNQILKGQSMVEREYSPFFDAEVLVAGIPLRSNGQVTGALFIHAPLAPLAANLGALQRVIVYALILGVLVATLLSLFFSRMLTGPLIQMNKVARAMATGDFSRQVAVPSRDELGLLAESLNVLSHELQEKIATLEKVDQNRREFVANVSHELRTPLTVIQGYAEAIQDGLARQEGREEEYLGNILEEVQRLRRMVDDLLDLRRMDEGQVLIKQELVDIAVLVQRVKERFSSLAGEKGAVLDVRLEEKLPPVIGEADRLEQVLINLVDNALRFTSPGGQVQLEARYERGQVFVSVKDTGQGIREEDMPLIWERFYKGDKSRHRATGGSGLGLAIARQIVELHKGTIRVESGSGKGTIFTFSLPAPCLPKK